jgi:8-oxo-dGTP pyrophosphatase MutT (NUDIX family)
VTFRACLERLERSLHSPLPGGAAQAVMAPRFDGPWPFAVDPSKLRHAAGLLLLVPRDDRAHVILTERADSLGRHSGQVSLPGGVVEPGENDEQAARRESREEIGLSLDDVRTLGALTPVDIHVSGFRLQPIVAASMSRPNLRPSDGEVARILEVSIDTLTDPSTIVWRSIVREGRHFEVPTFVVDGADVWGATAMVLAEFLALLGWKGI